MRSMVLALALLLGFSLQPVALAQEAEVPAESDDDVVNVVRVADSVVQIRVPGANGSGVRVSDGVLTAAHVVQNAAVISLIKPDGTRGSATLVSCNEALDLALLSTD